MARDGNSDFILNYIGEGESLDYLKHLCFLRVREENTQSCKIWNLHNTIQNTSWGNILFVELNSLLKRYIPSGGYETFPWIRQKVYLNDDAYRNRKARINGKYGRKTKKYNYRFKILRDTSAAVRFYQELYAPYINFRFGDAAHLRRLEEMRRVVRKGFLLQVFDGGGWVAGAACRRRKEEVTLFALGLLSDFNYHLRRGALSSVYYFLFKWAEENDIHAIDLLRSKPNVNDGVYEYKRLWGATAEKDIWPHTSMKIFIQQRVDISPMLKGLLVWTGNGFLELDKAVKRG